MSTWTLRYVPAGGAAVQQTLSEWGVESCAVEMINADIDTLTLTTDEALDADPQWETGATLELYQDSTRRFRGTVATPQSTGEGHSERRSYLARGPWWYATRLGYSQTWHAYAGTEVRFPRVLLYYNASTADVIRDVAARVNNAGGPWGDGTIDATAVPRPERGQALRCHEVILRCLRFMPDAVCWFDYADGGDAVPFSCRRASDLAAVTLDLDLAGGAGEVDAVEITSNSDALPSAVRIILKKQTPVDADDAEITADSTAPFDRYLTSFTTVTWPADFAGSEFDVIEVPADESDDFGQPQALAIAQQVYESANALAWRGTATLVNDDARFDLRPGQKLSFSGGRAEWETMGAIIQQVTHDVMAGQTTVSFDPPRHLSPADAIDLLIALSPKKRVKESDAEERDTGESEDWNFDKEEDPEKPAVVADAWHDFIVEKDGERWLANIAVRGALRPVPGA